MFTGDNNIQNIRQLIKELKTYVEMQKEYTKLELTEKITVLLSTLILAIVLILSGLMVLFYLSFSFACLLSPYVGGLPVSYAIIAGIVLLFVVVVIIFRKKFIINPIANFLANLFLK
ncbi:MAG: phage holin family protein [Mediterranea sp.]|jgi:sterol desaturase/sphingolipid hydroxylase (fatty acid hydroxylase superfamily)|nr:phage holin family protein [Mediterranea sp.]